MIKRYVFRDGCFRCKETGEPMPIPERDGVCVPAAIIHDFEPYQSVVEQGRVIGGRSQRREELARQADKGMVPFERIDGHPGGLINKKFAAQGGRRVSEAAVEWAAKKKAATAVKTDASGAILSE